MNSIYNINREHNFHVKVRIIDKYRKPEHLQFQKTTERKFFEETVIISAHDEKSAASRAIDYFSNYWPKKKYVLQVLEVEK